jgi:broad specificity phosphatase PhoE
MKKTILLIRHGETASPPGTFCGSMDVALSDIGQRQSLFLLDTIRQNRAELVITSGMKRTDYVGTLARMKGFKHAVDPDFREVHFGEWEGLTWPEIEQRYLELAVQWMEQPGEMRFPGGESVKELNKRVDQAWQRMLARPEQTIAIVGHSAALVGVIATITGNQTPHYLRYGEVMRLEVPG